MRGYRVEQFTPDIQKGIRLHQYIDTFTDDHPIFRQSKRLISPARRRYAGILIDIFYDHYLALNWSAYSRQSLGSFTQEVYGLLERHFDSLPERLQQITPHLIREDWLMSYGSESGLELTFQRLARRIKRDNQVANAVDDLRTNHLALSQDFGQFFPRLQVAVRDYQGEH